MKSEDHIRKPVRKKPMCITKEMMESLEHRLSLIQMENRQETFSKLDPKCGLRSWKKRLDIEEVIQPSFREIWS